MVILCCSRWSCAVISPFSVFHSSDKYSESHRCKHSSGWYDLQFTEVDYYVTHLLVPFAGNCFMSSEKAAFVVTASVSG